MTRNSCDAAPDMMSMPCASRKIRAGVGSCPVPCFPVRILMIIAWPARPVLEIMSPQRINSGAGKTCGAHRALPYP